MHGFGIIVWPGGDVFEGEFNEDKKNGFGIFYNQQKVYIYGKIIKLMVKLSLLMMRK